MAARMQRKRRQVIRGYRRPLRTSGTARVVSAPLSEKDRNTIWNQSDAWGVSKGGSKQPEAFLSPSPESHNY